MSAEKTKILEMLESGKITVQEAEQLLDALGTPEIKSITGKKLRIYVVGETEKDKNVNVNVAVPIALARLLDNVIENCIPFEALEQMKKQGINLKEIRLGEMIGMLENLGEDIVNADIKADDSDFKVRIYVE